MAVKVPRPPAGLAPRGRRLWREVHQRYVMNELEVQRLAELCKVLDRCDAIAAELEGQPMVVTGSAGQLRAHPLLTVLQGQQVLADRLATALLPGGNAGHQAKAARARWAKAPALASVTPIGGASGA